MSNCTCTNTKLSASDQRAISPFRFETYMVVGKDNSDFHVGLKSSNNASVLYFAHVQFNV